MSKTVEDIGTLKINLLSQAQYEAEVAGGTIEPNELYLTPSSGSGVADVEVNGESVVSGGVAEITINDIPSGGTTGQVLTKDSATDYDVSWEDPSGGTITDVEVDGTSVVTAGVAEIDLTGKANVSHTHTKSQITDFPTIPTITDTYSSSSSNGMSGKAVNSALQTLDGTISGSAGAGKTLTAFSQTDGKVSATFGNISITKSQVSDFPAIPTKVSDLSNDSGFITTETDPVYSASPASGITSTDISNWNSIVSDDHKWNDVTLTKTSTTASADLYAPFLLNTSATEAKLLKISATPTAYCIPKYDGYTYLYSTTPSASDNSTKVATTAYVDGAIPTVNNATLTIQKNSTNVATFTANASSNVTADISVPTDTGDLTNGAGYITGVTSTSTPTASTIAEFDSTAHMNSTDMTSQEVSDFVDSLNVTGINAVDYIVEQGTSGEWTYRKWNSGVAECWGNCTWSSVGTTAVSSWYYGVFTAYFPFTFTSAPVCVANGKWDTGISWVTARDVTTSDVLLHGLKNGAGASSVNARIYAKGTWK